MQKLHGKVMFKSCKVLNCTLDGWKERSGAFSWLKFCARAWERESILMFSAHLQLGSTHSAIEKVKIMHKKWTIRTEKQDSLELLKPEKLQEALRDERWSILTSFIKIVKLYNSIVYSEFPCWIIKKKHIKLPNIVICHLIFCSMHNVLIVQ